MTTSNPRRRRRLFWWCADPPDYKYVGVSKLPKPTRHIVTIKDLRHRLAFDVERDGEGMDGFA